MRTPDRSTDVLVVGAGPVGMTAAALLASHGTRVTVIEKNATTADDPKAISLDDESLRVYQRAGIDSDVLQVIVPGTGTMYYDSDNEPIFHGGAPVPYRSGFPFKNPFAQPELERVLRDTLERHPLVDLRFSTELVSFEQDAGGVEATALSPAGTHRIRSAFVLGADGGRSWVRSLLGIGMTGQSYDDVWLVIDCTGDARSERYGMHHGDPRRPHVIVPGLGGRCRYEFYLHPGEGEVTSHPPFSLIERLLAPHRRVTPDQVERAVAYRFHGLNADEWRRGRAFLLGDAAHMMPPFAGQGLNSGIRDAANMTWKLAAVLRDEASEVLLDSYQEERRPHAEAVIRSSERLGRVVMTTNERLARARDRSVRRALETPEGRAFYEGMHYRPSTRITTGLVVDPEAHSLVGTAIGQPTVFDLGAHTSTKFDDLIGNGWAVVGVGIDADIDGVSWGRVTEAFDFLAPRYVDVPLDDTIHTRRHPIRIALDLDTRLYAEFDTARGRFVVVRPDRVVAAVTDPAAVAAVAARLDVLSPRAPLVAAASA